MKSTYPQPVKPRSEYMRKYRADGRDMDSRRARYKAQDRAITWIIDTHPEVWYRILDQAYNDLGIERRRPGRPRNKP